MSGRHRRDRSTPPPGMQDQWDAAEREAHRIMLDGARWQNRPIGRHVDHDGADPVLDVMLDRIRAWATSGDRVPRCEHAQAPQPMFLDYYRHPWLIRCKDCLLALGPATTLQDNTCDYCGDVDPEGTYPVQIALGPILVSLGRCENCTPEHIKARNSHH